MTEDFDQCLAFTLLEEGGYVDNISDPGGATNMGITLTTLREWSGDANLQPRDVEVMKRQTAAGIYCANYWNRLRCDALPCGIDLMVFDFGVNTGCQATARLLQNALGLSGDDVDGCVGPFTLRHAAAKAPIVVVDALRSAQEARYKITDGFSVFGRGWLTRTARRFTRATEMILAKRESSGVEL